MHIIKKFQSNLSFKSFIEFYIHKVIYSVYFKSSIIPCEAARKLNLKSSQNERLHQRQE